ncbi:MAG TPA: hypothetical protein VK595_16835 [Vicinamibacterales bacterium]|nr:hypothetical protein [Vicinamibacterales bacterium]
MTRRFYNRYTPSLVGVELGPQPYAGTSAAMVPQTLLLVVRMYK